MAKITSSRRVVPLFRLLVVVSISLVLVIAAAAQEPARTETPALATALIPEPLLMDMALPLGTERGRLEVNSIFRVPTGDGKVISVPEVEGTVLDGFGLEFELEFEGSRQTGWSAAAQLTLGMGLNQQFIHGVQITIERNDSRETTEIVALYIPAFRFSPVWSTLIMAGARTPVSGAGDTQFVFNGSVFAEISNSLTLGLEMNYRADILRTEKLTLIPQLHWSISNHTAIQIGFSVWQDDSSTETEAVLRAIYAF